MQRHLATTALIAATAAAALPAHSAIVTESFSGTVFQAQGVGRSIGDTISGGFAFDTGTSTFSWFTIDGVSVPASASRVDSAVIPVALTDAFYQAQISPVPAGTGQNVTFSLDLSSLTLWPDNDAIALLGNAQQLSTNLDTVDNPLSAFPSTFGYYMAAASGTSIQQLTANLRSIQSVPEPGALSLVIGALAMLGVRRRSVVR